MAKNDQGMKEIELEGYRAGLAGESRSNLLYFSRDERMCFEQGYYRGAVEIARKRQEKKEAENGR